jgi:drug/metabolite transporter (DMT)-like permease
MRSSLTPVDRSAPAWQVWAALLIVYIVWGSTYLAIRVVVETLPPFLASGIRFATAGLILGALLAVRSGPARLRVSRRELAGSALIGLLLLCVGNAMVSVGEQTVPSGVAALVIGIVPLMVLLLRWLFGERVPITALLGVGVGFVGLAVLAIPGGLDGSIDAAGMLVLVIASASWASGSFLSRRVPLPRDPLVSTTWQLISAAVALLIITTLTGEWHFAGSASPASIVALLYLITFGSLLAYTAYTWLLQHAPISRVATYAYVNPVVAVFLGAVILNEQITPSVAIGALLIVASVAFTIWAESRGRRGRTQATVETPPEPGPEVAAG